MKIEQNVYCNPIAFDTARASWSPRESFLQRLFKTVTGASRENLSTRLFKTGTAVAYDFFVKNPRDLTIGNWKVALHTNSKLKKVEAVTLMVLGALYSLMLYGITGILLGSSIAALGGWLKIPLLAKCGKGIESIAEKIFLTGSVPTWGLVYALPKKIIENLPLVFINTMKKIHHVGLWFFNHAMMPVVKVVGRVIEKVAGVVVGLFRRCGKIALFIFEKTILPFWKHVMGPIVRIFGKVLHWSASLVIDLLGKTSHAAGWMFAKIILPCWKYALKPILSGIVRAIYWSASRVVDLIKMTGHAASWVFNKILFPPLSAIFRGVAFTCKALGKYLIKPVCGATWHCLTIVAEKISLITRPIWRQIALVSCYLGNRLMDLGKWTDQLFVHLWTEISNAWEKIIPFCA